MDIVTALSSVGQAINIAKSLRDLEKGLDSATYKAQIAELYSALADVKMALTDTQTALHDKDQKIRALESAIEDMKAGETCPICGTGRMKLTSARPHPQFGVFGHEERAYECTNPECNHTAERKHIPKE